MIKNILSGMGYFLVTSLTIIVILMIIAVLNPQIITFVGNGNNEAIPTDETTEKPTSAYTAPVTVKPAATEENKNENNEILNGVIDSIVNNSVSYDGDLELPVNGATGYASVNINVISDDFSVIATLKAGTAFLILQETDEFWYISFKTDESDGSMKEGWVRHAYCMINLPDVIPSIIYNNTNAYKSLFRSRGAYIPNITGEQLYSYTDGDYEGHEGRAYNERLNKYEYIVPVLYSMSKRICKAQHNALAEGNTLVIYEGFRPYSVQRLVAVELQKYANAEPFIMKGINTGSWSIGWFIATGVSNHQQGYAIDTNLAWFKEKDTVMMVTGKYKYMQIQNYAEHYMFTPIHELSTDAVIYTGPHSTEFSDAMKDCIPAQNLQKYCMDAGLSPLASEWWHFNDEETHRTTPALGEGKYEIKDCLSKPPTS